MKRHQAARFGSLALELFPATGPVRLCLFPVLNRWKMACQAVAQKHRAQKPVDQPAFVTLWRGSLHFCCAKRNMGLTGLEPVTLRLSSACSNQLSYRPLLAASPRNFEFRLPIFDCSRDALRGELLKSTIANRKSKMEYQEVRLRHGYGATVFALLYGASEDWRQGDSNP